MLESAYQSHVIQRLKEEFPGCLILKNDADYLQGIPDLTVLYRNRWAVLEVKASSTSRNRPNQDWYIRTLDEMSFAAFIYPENEEDVFRDLQSALRPRRVTRVS